MFSEEYLLKNATGRRLYHAYAKGLPIIDYHCHLQPAEICENKTFESIGELWLAHDHYKWRAMRAFGVDEKYVTGGASYREKFCAFAEILPELAGNPLYLWCALELKRYFDVEEPLCKANSGEIFDRTSKIIAERRMTPRSLIENSNVEMLCTTEDPVDPLTFHRKLQQDASFKTKIISAFRPDKAFYVEKETFPGYVKSLSQASNLPVDRFDGLIAALEARLLTFKEMGSMISDSGIENLTWMECSPEQAERAFQKGLRGESLEAEETARYKSAFLTRMAELYRRHGFVMQLHIGTYQGANRYMEKKIGAATGYDCADDNTAVQSVGALLNRLTETDTLPRTFLYPLDASKMELFAILAGAFCEAGTRGKVQLGAPWWFNDQPQGLRRQFEFAANHYPVSLSAGMVTDSRSFLSYSRHEVYRRVFCDWLGSLAESGEYFSGEEALKNLVEKVCYRNAKEYFC
jgi:glucuronate isomerase